MVIKTVLLIAIMIFSCVPISEAAPHSVYQGFAEPIPSYSLSTLSLDFADAVGQRTLSVSSNDYAVYRYAYVSTDGSPWQRLDLSGKTLGGDWLNGSVTGQVSFTASDFGLSQSRLSARRNYVVVYSCSRSAWLWDCHTGWQIWQFDATIQPSAPDVKIIRTFDSAHLAGNVPENTLDGNMDGEESVWSSNGDGEWIAYELSEEAFVSYVRLAFYSYSIRYFDIQVSSDGSAWNDVLTGQSSHAYMGDTFQRFEFSPVTARYVRFYGHGSNVSLWNAIVETDINGFGVDIAAPVCESRAYSACYGDDVWWFDSCGEPEEMIQDCQGGETCSSGQCIETGTVILYQNDFEKRPLGRYSSISEFSADWNVTYYGAFNQRRRTARDRQRQAGCGRRP